MDISTTQLVKSAIVAATGLERDALHIYVGLAVFILVALVARQRPSSVVPWLCVLAVAVLGELIDRRDDIAALGYWRRRASLHDVLNTMFWPTVLMLLARLRWLHPRERERRQA